MEHGLHRLATKLGLDNRVRIVGQISDIEQVWATRAPIGAVTAALVRVGQAMNTPPFVEKTPNRPKRRRLQSKLSSLRSQSFEF